MGKLGAATGDPTAVMVDLGALGVVNGPEDLPDWDAIKWSQQEAQVRRLRQRIFKAAQAADWKQLRNLQTPERVFQVVHSDLPVGFPILRTLDAFPGRYGQCQRSG